MIYFYVLDLDLPGFDEKIPVVINATHGSVSNVGTEDIIKNPGILEEFRGTGEEISVAWPSNRSVPLIVFDSNSVEGDKFVNCTDVWGLVSTTKEKFNGNIPKEVMSKMVEMISKRYSRDEAALKIAMCTRQWDYERVSEDDLSFPINIGAGFYDDLAVMSMKRIEQHNSKYQNTFRVLNPEDNVTLHQDSCTDEFYIEIPDFSFIDPDEGVQYSKSIPKRSEVCSPYDDVNAESSNYKTKVASYLIPLIEGNPSNNNLGIQQNEQRYYDSLCKWVRYNVEQDFGEGADENIIDGLSQRYLTELAQRIYSWHWKHNRNMPVTVFDSSDDSENHDEDVSSTVSMYGYALDSDRKDDVLHINALTTLERYLEEASAKVGYKAYVEAVIKLARWGERKCTRLVIDGYDVAFDLATNTVKRNLGDISSYTVEVIDGKKHNMDGFIYFTSKIADSSFGIEDFSIPIGLIVSTKMTKDDRTLVIPQYIPMVDAIPMIRKGELTIMGIDVEGDLIHVDGSKCNSQAYHVGDLVNRYVGDMDSFLQNPFYRSDDLLEVCMMFGADKGVVNQSLLPILNEAICSQNLKEEFKNFAVASVDELKAKIISGDIFSISGAMNVNVTRVIMPLLVKAEKLWEESGKSIEDAFSIWDSVLKDGVDYSNVWSTAIVEPVGHEVGANNNNNSGSGSSNDDSKSSITIDPMASFNSGSIENSKVTESSGDGMLERGDLLIRAIKPDAVFVKLFDLEGNRIGGYTKEVAEVKGRKVNRFIFVDNEYLNTVPDDRIDSRGVVFIKVFHVLVKNLYAISTGKMDNLNAFFNSDSTIVNYYNAVRTMKDQVLAMQKELQLKTQD